MCKECSCPRSPWLEFWRTLDVPDWGFSSWSWWGGVHNVPNNLFSKIQLSTLNIKVHRTRMSPKSWSGGLGFRFLIMMGTCYPRPHNSVDLNFPKRTPTGQVINYGLCDLKRDGQTCKHPHTHYSFVYRDMDTYLVQNYEQLLNKAIHLKLSSVYKFMQNSKQLPNKANHLK